MEIIGEIVTPYYDYGGRKYLDLRWNNTVTRVKVPFRYNRVMCRVEGIIPIQELKAGQKNKSTLRTKNLGKGVTTMSSTQSLLFRF